MIVKTLDSIKGTSHDVDCPKGAFKSVRFLVARDCMGFSVHKTIVNKGGPYRWHYKRHLEACYCLSGTGVLTSGGKEWEIVEDTIYALDKYDSHELTVSSNKLILLSIFNPPVLGTEVHQEDGSYAKA